jgi:hypothetical protein
MNSSRPNPDTRRGAEGSAKAASSPAHRYDRLLPTIPARAARQLRSSTDRHTDMGSSTTATHEPTSTSGAAAHAIVEGRDAVAAWLKTAQIQQVDGPGRGGIAGTLDASGRAAFLYGEITGYWLRWASIYAPDPQSMSSAVEFLQVQWSGPDPALTRLGAGADWRNSAVFSFDLAMILRGLADAAPIAGHDRCAQTATRIVPWLARMIDAQGILQSHLALNGAELPARWSTRPGPFLAKTSAAILRAGDWLEPALERAARKTLARWRDRAMEHEDLHPRFYAMEGRAANGDAIDAALVLATRHAEGWFPECAGIPGGRARGDIQAQALRLLCLTDATDTMRDAVAGALLRHVQADGSVRCYLDEPDANVWCALFAHQALDWLCWQRGGGALAAPDGALII